MNKLEAIYEQKSEFNIMMVHKYAYCSSDSMARHVSKVESLAKEVKECREELSDTAIMTKILSTLPATYRSLRQAWLSLDSAYQTIPNLISHLIDKEGSLTNETNSSETALVITKRNPKGADNRGNQSNTNVTSNSSHRFVCYNYNKRGQFAKECRASKKSIRKNQEQRDMLAFSAENNMYTIYG